MGPGAVLRIEDDLGEPPSVPQVDKDDAAVVPAGRYPTHQDHPLTEMLGGEGAAVMGALPVTKRIELAGGHASSSAILVCRASRLVYFRPRAESKSRDYGFRSSFGAAIFARPFVPESEEDVVW